MLHKYCSGDHADHFQNFFQLHKQKGHGYSRIVPYIGIQHQKGYGIGNILGGVLRGVLNIAKPALRSAGKHLVKSAVEGGKNIFENVVSGRKNIKQAFKDEASSQLRNIGKDSIGYIADQVSARGKKRKKTSSSGINKKRKKTKSQKLVRDIFN